MHRLCRAGGALLLVPPAGCFSMALCNGTPKPAPVVKICGICRPQNNEPPAPPPGRSNRRLGLSTHWCIIPHPKKAQKGGEDACYATTLSVGVADGVGGWGSRTVDAGLYAKALMREANNVAKSTQLEFEAEPISCPSPRDLLWQAFRHVEKQAIIGSTTATVACLKENRLQIANLGDSGFFLLRAGRLDGQLDGPLEVKLLHRSREQQHYFNCPYQIGSGCDDTPDDASIEEFEVRAGDILLLATDGVFDNLFDEKILELVNQGSESDQLAVNIATAAHEVGLQVMGKTPFSVKAKMAGYEFFDGGKLDDVTVLVACVVPL